MQFPKDLKMKERAHGHGAKGLAFYSYEDCAGLGVELDVRRQDRRSRFLESWRFRWLPDQVFATYSDLCAAVAALSDEAIAAEKTKWPRLHSIVEKSGPTNGSCWLHPDRPARFRGSIETCWIRGCIDMALLCEQCAEAAQADPLVIQRAVRQRHADVARRRHKLFEVPQ